jgi:hypothetical protein
MASCFGSVGEVLSGWPRLSYGHLTSGGFLGGKREDGCNGDADRVVKQ